MFLMCLSAAMAAMGAAAAQAAIAAFLIPGALEAQAKRGRREYGLAAVSQVRQEAAAVELLIGFMAMMAALVVVATWI